MSWAPDLQSIGVKPVSYVFALIPAGSADSTAEAIAVVDKIGSGPGNEVPESICAGRQPPPVAQGRRGSGRPQSPQPSHSRQICTAGPRPVSTKSVAAPDEVSNVFQHVTVAAGVTQNCAQT